jgi:alkanesulfonate monooxygenase SsuD/methylene tetrahydromethanopterin reductase-like flavin-dependent oxidoreductase (luciferase family)
LSVPVEVTVLRLHTKSPGSHHLRKTAAAELTQLLTAGWQEKERRVDTDHVVVRLERPRPARPSLPPVSGAGRPRR